MMKLPILKAVSLLGLTVLSTIGCEHADLLDSSRAALPVASGSHPGLTRSVPFQMVAGARFQNQDLAPGFGPPTFGRSLFDGRCSVPSDFVIRFSLRGVATHLGTVTAVVEHCTQIGFQTGINSMSDGEMIITAANGDQLWTNYAGVAPGPGLGIVEGHTLIGGTGRFTSATGTATSTAECDQEAGTCSFHMAGVVGFDASDRRVGPNSK